MSEETDKDGEKEAEKRLQQAIEEEAAAEAVSGENLAEEAAREAEESKAIEQAALSEPEVPVEKPTPLPQKTKPASKSEQVETVEQAQALAANLQATMDQSMAKVEKEAAQRNAEAAKIKSNDPASSLQALMNT